MEEFEKLKEEMSYMEEIADVCFDGYLLLGCNESADNVGAIAMALNNKKGLVESALVLAMLRSDDVKNTLLASVLRYLMEVVGSERAEGDENEDAKTIYPYLN